MFLLHFDCVGDSNWRRKWEERLDGTGTAVVLRKNRAAQLDIYAATREQGEEALMTLYRRMHMIPDHEKRILFDLGMLTTLNFKDHPRKVI